MDIGNKRTWTKEAEEALEAAIRYYIVTRKGSPAIHKDREDAYRNFEDKMEKIVMIPKSSK